MSGGSRVYGGKMSIRLTHLLLGLKEVDWERSPDGPLSLRYNRVLYPPIRWKGYPSGDNASVEFTDECW